MIGSAPYYPSYYLNRRGDEYSQYVTKMAYIPGVLPTVPPWQGQAKKPSEPPTCKPQDLVLEPPNIGLATFEDEAQGWANSSATGPTASSHVISPRVPASIGMLAASTRPSGSFGGNGLPSPVPAVTDGHVQSSAPWLTGTLVAPSGPGHVVGVAQPSPGRKRALEDEESSDSAEDRQPKPKRKKTNQGVKDDHEKQLIARYMQEEIDKNNVTETKWQNIAEKLKRHGFSRSGNSVKAYWSRHGRQEFGMDERRKPEGRKLVTSKQDPEERRKARERKKREAAEGADL